MSDYVRRVAQTFQDFRGTREISNLQGQAVACVKSISGAEFEIVINRHDDDHRNVLYAIDLGILLLVHFFGLDLDSQGAERFAVIPPPVVPFTRILPPKFSIRLTRLAPRCEINIQLDAPLIAQQYWNWHVCDSAFSIQREHLNHLYDYLHFGQPHLSRTIRSQEHVRRPFPGGQRTTGPLHFNRCFEFGAPVCCEL
jgi:hypothetical protein